LDVHIAALNAGGLVRRKLSVCLSVRPPIKHVHCDKREERSVRRRMVGGWRPLLPEILGQTGPRWSKIADYESIFTRSTSAI